jgi:hypothetical protein
MRQPVLAAFAALFLAPFTAYSQDVFFDHGGNHTFAGTAHNVYVGNGTKLTLLPGSDIGNYVHVYEDSELVVDGGSANSVQVYPTGSITILDGSIVGYAFLYGNTSGVVSGGTITNALSLEPVIAKLSPFTSTATGPGVTTLEVTGGLINRIQAPAQGNPLGQSSHAEVSGGTVSTVTMGSPFSSIDITGGDFNGTFYSGNIANISGGTFNLTNKMVMAGDAILTFCGGTDLVAVPLAELNVDYAVNGTLLSGDFLSNVRVQLTGNSVLELKIPVDSDGDGVLDDDDAFPDDPLEWEDTDGDGVGDNADEFPESITDAEFYVCGLEIVNVQLENGATLADEILIGLQNDTATPDLVLELQMYRDAGYITGREMGQIIRANNLNCID